MVSLVDLGEGVGFGVSLRCYSLVPSTSYLQSKCTSCNRDRIREPGKQNSMAKVSASSTTFFFFFAIFRSSMNFQTHAGGSMRFNQPDGDSTRFHGTRWRFGAFQ